MTLLRKFNPWKESIPSDGKEANAFKGDTDIQFAFRKTSLMIIGHGFTDSAIVHCKPGG